MIGRIEPSVGEGLFVGALQAVGLDGAAGLAGHHDDAALQAIGERAADHVGLR
jgi:hypothetical protein